MSIIPPCRAYHNLFKLNSCCTFQMASIYIWYFKALSNKGCYYHVFFHPLFCFFLFDRRTFWDLQQKTIGQSAERSAQLQADKMNGLEKVTSVTFVPKPTTPLFSTTWEVQMGGCVLKRCGTGGRIWYSRDRLVISQTLFDSVSLKSFCSWLTV